ncbi:MAG TPA: NUDIX hydrolase [Candidatus Paceibacterota bacterium]|nr:NUDIX hydrolase [Candidatus Paceibacterota bacterium]
MNKNDVIHCADAIAVLEGTGKLVFVERLGTEKGLAFPGGKLEQGESPESAIRREFLEETGLEFEPLSTVGFFDAPDRDPRGRYVSTVFSGIARGTPRSEAGKTRVVLLDYNEALRSLGRFRFDHGDILRDYLKLPDSV